MIKVSPQNRLAVLMLCVIYIFLFIMFFILNITGSMMQNVYLHYSLFAIMQLCFFIPLFYMMALLRLVHEKKEIFTAFYSFIAMNLVYIVAGLIPLKPQVRILIDSLSGMLVSLITLYFLIILFVIKDPLLSGPFKIYARSLLAMLIFTFGITIIGPDLHPDLYHKIAAYTPLAAIIPIIGTMYVIYGSDSLFKQSENKGHMEVLS